MNLIKSIKELPPLSKSFKDIHSVQQEEYPSMKALVNIIEKDPILTANLLKNANSPIYGFSREITSLQQTISLFGISTVIGFAINTLTKNMFKVNLKPYSISENQYSAISLIKNKLVSSWIKEENFGLANVLGTSSFLMDIGKILIANEIMETDKINDFQKLVEEIGYTKAEKELIGYTCEEVSAEIFNKWGFEKNIVESIQYCNNYNDAPSNIREKSLILYVIKLAVGNNVEFSEEDLNKAREIITRNNFKLSYFDKALFNLQEKLK